MDSFGKRLVDDAAEIQAEVSAPLRSRIDSATRAARSLEPRSGRKGFSFPLWLAASVTGGAAAVIVILFIGRGAGQIAPTGSAVVPADGAVARSVPEYVRHIERKLPLQVETAGLTAPLEEELTNLQSDLEKARENLEEDLDFTL